jgi:hypothetical protein
VPACAQASTSEFLPEIDAYMGLNSNVRLAFRAKETIAEGELTRSDIGPSIEAYLRPLEPLKRVIVFDLNETKCVPVLFSIGYRYLPAPDKPTVNRMEPAATFHFPLKSFLITDKNRADLDWSVGSFSWRYRRNRLTAERRLTIHSYHPAPYISAEAFYDLLSQEQEVKPGTDSREVSPLVARADGNSGTGRAPTSTRSGANCH